MVVKGNFTRRAPPPKIVIPKLHNPFISNIAALKRKPNQQEALNILYDIANKVTPIMKEYGFKVHSLVEFSPKTDNLLGMNMNHGLKIFIRLRPPHNDHDFFPMNELVGTMLHELTHIKHGPHDSKFYNLLDELTTKQELILARGGALYQEPFQGQGTKLGGKHAANITASRLKKLDIKYHGGVSKLGGSGKEGDLKELIRQAAIKRYEDNKWCHDAVNGDLPADDELDVIEIGSDDFEEFSKESVIKKRELEIEEPSTRQDIPSKKEKRQERTEEIVILDDEDIDLKLSSLTPNTKKDPNSEPTSTTEIIDLTND